jgi:hypothetical protein
MTDYESATDAERDRRRAILIDELHYQLIETRMEYVHEIIDAVSGDPEAAKGYEARLAELQGYLDIEDPAARWAAFVEAELESGWRQLAFPPKGEGQA